MKTVVVAAASVLVIGSLATPSVRASCAGSMPMNQLFVPLINCPDPDPGPTGPDPVKMYSWLISSPSSVNSNGLGGMCYDVNRKNGIGQECTTAVFVGVAGDGNVAVQYDWEAPGTSGCPSVSRNDGDDPVAISVRASGAYSVLVTVGYSNITAGYVVDFAFPYDAALGLPAPASCSPRDGLVWESGVPGGSVCVNASAPQIVSDCDPASTSIAGLQGGAGASCLSTANMPVVGRGRLYYKEVACGTSPDLATSSGWTALPVSPDTNGNACNFVPQVASVFNCMFVGTTSTLNGLETPAITGLFTNPRLAAGDKVKISSATFNRGKLDVEFSTENEMTIVGFDVYAGEARLNAGLIPANGTGSNDYSFSIGRGAIKNHHTVTVGAVLSTGATVMSNTVTLK